MGQIKNLATQMEPHQRNVSIVLDEMAIKSHLSYNAKFDNIDGLTKTGDMANQVMVVMCQSIACKWKQVSSRACKSICIQSVAPLILEYSHTFISGNCFLYGQVCFASSRNSRCASGGCETHSGHRLNSKRTDLVILY